ncbi:SWIM zinc finger family protein [Coraliomargarita sp. W4R53]
MSGKKARSLSAPYALLTWEALEESFGKRILDRGERYQQGGRVTALARFAQNGLVARVAGSENYVSRVLVMDGSKLQTLCTCPYGAGCKHAVAVVLEYLECLKEKRKVELIKEPELDERLIELEEEPAFADDLVEARKSASHELDKFLRAKTKPQLVSLCMEMSEAIPQARQWLQDQQLLAAKDPSKFLKTIRSELAALEDTQWDGHGYGGHSADLTRLKTQLKALADLKEYLILTELGPELLSAGNEAVQHEHESESYYDLSECLDIIFDALTRSSLNVAEQLLWVIDLYLQDDYGLCGDAAGEFLGRKHSPSAWSTVANKLKEQLSSMPVPGRRSDYSQIYQRNRVSGHLSNALKQAGRSKELTAHYLSEAKTAGRYDELVKHLIEQKDWNEAKKHCIAGINAAGRQSSAAHVGRLY